jgi:hypothetical protein
LPHWALVQLWEGELLGAAERQIVDDDRLVAHAPAAERGLDEKAELLRRMVWSRQRRLQVFDQAVPLLGERLYPKTGNNAHGLVFGCFGEGGGAWEASGGKANNG